MRFRVGVDSGGTFTDVCLFDQDSGDIRVWKLPSTPDDPSRAIAAGVLQGLAETFQGSPGEIAYFGHGTTVATNALIQHRGAPTGLITTAGFRDLLELGRQRRPHLYDLQCDKPPCLVARDNRYGVAERLRHDGRIATPLDEDAVRAAIRALKDSGVQAVAVCFLFSYVDPRHEQRVLALLAEEFPEAFASASHQVAPEFREYERLSTVVVNAYLGPVMARYLRALAPRLAEAGVPAAPHITQSNGGTISFEAAADDPVRTVLSGPATGITGALAVAERAGFADLITFDMGGTSTDVALIPGGRPQLAASMEVHGYPLKTPMLDIHTVGAGGGSIATVDAGGLLKVGPASAGSMPGPACYGLGGTDPTVTDANVLLQTLNPTEILGGRMRLNQDAARIAIAALAEKLGLDIMATAQGIISVVIANMARAIRVISIQRGHDPRDYVLVAFGGAGPLHAALLARELEMPRVLVPRYPGILCAMGLLVADLKRNDALTRHMPLDDAVGLQDAFAVLEQRAEDWFRDEGISPPDRTLTRSIDARYAGQNYELSIPFVPGVSLRAAFEAAHQRMYNYIAADEPIQLITFRTEATGRVRKADIAAYPPATTDIAAACIGHRAVWQEISNDFVRCPVYDRERLGPGHRLSGPAIIEQMDSTTVLPADMHATVDPYLNLIMEFVR